MTTAPFETPTPDEIRERALPIFAEFPEIAVAYLFGSFARGEAGPESDLDFGIVYRRRGETALDHMWELLDLASRLESVAPGRRIDLVVLESQGPLFAHQVLLEGRLVHESDPERRVDFEAETCLRAFDFRPTFELATRGKIQAAIRWAD